MIASEMTDRDLLDFIDRELSRKVQVYAMLIADERNWTFRSEEHYQEAQARWQARGEQMEDYRRLCNLIRLGVRIIDRAPGVEGMEHRPWNDDPKDCEFEPLVDRQYLSHPAKVQKIAQSALSAARALEDHARNLRTAAQALEGGA